MVIGEYHTSFFQTAANEARLGKKVNVGQRANELAQQVADYVGIPAGFDRVEAVKGYLNLYYSTAAYTPPCGGQCYGRRESLWLWDKTRRTGDGRIFPAEYP